MCKWKFIQFSNLNENNDIAKKYKKNIKIKKINLCQNKKTKIVAITII